MGRRVLSRWCAAYAALAVFLSCSPDGIPPGAGSLPPSADINMRPPGVADRAHDPSVLALVVDGNIACGGALIAPDVVMTARSCVTTGEPGDLCAADAGISVRDPASLGVLMGENGSTGGLRGQGRDVILLSDSNHCGGDIALVRLTEPIYVSKPLSVRTTGVATGDHVRTSGYAIGDAGAVKIVRDHVEVVATNESDFGLAEACWAMAGSPALDESKGEIVGVLSTAIGTTCSGDEAENGYTRADAYYSLIHSALSQTVTSGTVAGELKELVGSVDVGSFCSQAPDCSAGVCVSEGSHQFCSRVCGSHDRCPYLYKCVITREGAFVCSD